MSTKLKFIITNKINNNNIIIEYICLYRDNEQ